jgi:hypothetical protein
VADLTLNHAGGPDADLAHVRPGLSDSNDPWGPPKGGGVPANQSQLFKYGEAPLGCALADRSVFPSEEPPGHLVGGNHPVCADPGQDLAVTERDLVTGSTSHPFLYDATGWPSGTVLILIGWPTKR